MKSILRINFKKKLERVNIILRSIIVAVLIINSMEILKNKLMKLRKQVNKIKLMPTIKFTIPIQK
jgi:hypothetical protein